MPSNFEMSYFGVTIIGLLHGVEPGHGWPVALMYAFRGKRLLSRGLLSSTILSIFHFLSSIAVVAAYALLNIYLTISVPELKYAAAGLLLFLAYRLLTKKPQQNTEGKREHIHELEHEETFDATVTHVRRREVDLTLRGISAYAFLLGFAHEEEFVLLALAVGGVNPWLLMVIYAISVTAGLIGITMIILAVCKGLEGKIRRHGALIPKITGAVLIIMAISLVLGLWI